MTDHTELVKALREYSGCRKGEIARITSDAADAIEELQAEVRFWEAAVKGQEDGIKVLQAEVERLKADVDAAYAH